MQQSKVGEKLAKVLAYAGIAWLLIDAAARSSFEDPKDAMAQTIRWVSFLVVGLSLTAFVGVSLILEQVVEKVGGPEAMNKLLGL